MSKDWDRLAGERGEKVKTGRWGRAFKLGKVATRMAGSMLRSQIGTGKKTDEEKAAALADAAMKNVDQLVAVMGQMKGAAMKIGQMLSSDPDIVAPEFADSLAALQQSAPPMEYVTIASQIEAALDQPIEDVFRFFDPEPLGSASIGQVHRATLFDGRDVAVKVQYPGIHDSLESDLKNLGSMLTMGRVFMTKEKTDGFLREARESILGETDYLAEANNLARFVELFADRPRVKVPAPIMELCRPTLLVMEFVAGTKIDDAMTAIEDVAERTKVAERFVETFVFMFHELNALHADPHPGNFLLTPEHDLVLLDFGCVKDYDPELPEGVLDLLVAFWADDMPRMEVLFREMGFGKEGGTFPSHDVMRAYHHLILEPLVEDAPFNMSTWKVHARVRQFMRRNMSMIRLVPPPELLMYLRVLAGVKGILTRVDVAVNIRAIAIEACRRHGKLEA